MDKEQRITWEVTEFEDDERMPNDETREVPSLKKRKRIHINTNPTKLGISIESIDEHLIHIQIGVPSFKV